MSTLPLDPNNPNNLDMFNNVTAEAMGLPGKKTKGSGGSRNAPAGSRNAAILNNKFMQLLYENQRRNISKLDRIQAVGRIKWKFKGIDMTAKLLERMLYLRYLLMLYWDDQLLHYRILPAIMASQNTSTIDMYGRWQLVRPVTFNGRSEDDDLYTGKNRYLSTIIREPVSNLDFKNFDRNKHCILLRDFTQEFGEMSAPTWSTQNSLIRLQAEILPRIRKILKKLSRNDIIKGVSANELESVRYELQALESTDFDEETINAIGKFSNLDIINAVTDNSRALETLTKAYETIEAYRLKNLGVSNNTGFKKQAHMLQDEVENSDISDDMILDNYFDERQNFVELGNHFFPDIELWCGLNETVEDKRLEKEEESDEEVYNETDND